MEQATAAGVPVRVIGQTGGNRLRIATGGRMTVDVSIEDAERAWSAAIDSYFAEEDRLMDKFKDECGVFGIFGHPEAANMTYLGLYALQHRGQESAGIAASDGAQIRLSKAMGYVADTFDGETLSQLPGSMAIGHVRYSTAGESKISNAQPILIECGHGQIAICHNGNLVNAGEVRSELVRQGSIFQSSSDTEVILHLYARSRAPESSRCSGRIGLAGPGGFLPGADDPRPHDRHPRSPRLPSARARAPRQRDGHRLGNLCHGSHRRHLHPGHRARRSPGRQRRGDPVDQAVSAGAARALCLRACVLRAARQLCVREKRERDQDEPGPHPRPRATGRGRRHRAGSRFGCVRRDGLCRSRGHAAGHGPDPQSLCRPDVHSAAGVDPPLRREGQVESSPQHSGWQARRPRGRFDRPRHDQPQDREDGARRRGQGSARPDQLSTDHLSVLLRR